MPRQQFPTFLAPETSFTEDSFSTDRPQRRGDGLGIIQRYYIYCALYLYYCYIVMYSEIIIQFTIMQTDRRLSSNVSDGEGLKIQTKLQLLAWALTSCCAAWLLTSHPPVAVHGLGAMGTPVLWYSYKWMLPLALKISIQLTKVQACKTAQMHMSHKKDLARPCTLLL